MTADDLKKACTDFEMEHGIEAFLDAMASIMQDRMALQGLDLQFIDEDDQQTDPGDQIRSRG